MVINVVGLRQYPNESVCNCRVGVVGGMLGGNFTAQLMHV